MALLAIAAGCARHYLTANQGKEGYGMGLDINITDAGYLAGRLFALCENIQKHGRNWGPTLSDKLFSAAIDRPRQTMVQLYKNCLCYDIYKTDSEWFEEIFDKVKQQVGNFLALIEIFVSHEVNLMALQEKSQGVIVRLGKMGTLVKY